MRLRINPQFLTTPNLEKIVMLPQPDHVAEDRPEGALHNDSHLLLVQALRSTDKLPLDVSSFPTEFGGWGGGVGRISKAKI